MACGSLIVSCIQIHRQFPYDSLSTVIDDGTKRLMTGLTVLQQIRRNYYSSHLPLHLVPDDNDKSAFCLQKAETVVRNMS